jgi:hypothetical protein
MWRSNSSVSSRSSGLPPDIINSENVSFESNESFNFHKWNIPKIKYTDIYTDSSWTQNIFKSEYAVKTVEQTYAISGKNCSFQLFGKKFLEEAKAKKYKFLHIGSVQVAVKPLTRLGIDASVLLCLRDARFLQFKPSILGMIQSSVYAGPVHFDVFPNMSVSLDDINFLKTLTLNIQTKGYDMEEGSRPLAIIYRIYYRLMKTSLNPQAIFKDPKGSTLLIESSTQNVAISAPKMIQWDKLNLPNEWILESVSKPTTVVSRSSDVDIIEQYLNGDVKINFADLNVSGHIQRPLPIDNRRYSFAGSSTTEGIRNIDKEIDALLADAARMKEKTVKGIGDDSANSQISQAFYSTKSHPPNGEDDDSGSLSPSASDINGPLPPPPPQQIPGQLLVLNAETHPVNFFHQIDWTALHKDFSSKENQIFRHAYRAKFSKKERDQIKVQWTEKMISSRKHILFFDFLQKYFPLDDNTLNVVKKKFTKEDKTVVNASHPPLESILIDVKGVSVKASPFKMPKNDCPDDSRAIIEQNNFVNQSLHTIGQQLDRIEEKFSSTSSKEDPLISLPDNRKSLGLKPKSEKTMEKIEAMLSDLKISQASSSGKMISPLSYPLTDTDSSTSSTDADIKILEKTFGKENLEPKVQRIYDKPKSVGFTKNWYSRPTPPDLQFEERFLQTQFSVSSEKIYEWNIDGLSEQELLNKMNHMSMVAIAYDANQNLSQSEIVDLLATGFSGTLRSWWDKHLTEETREGIRKAVKKGDDGFPIFNEKVGMGEPDSVNTLIYTIIKHFIGTPSNITARISDVLNNLRCPTMFDYKWYQDVFHSRVMLKTDSNKPYWKEKFIDGLPSLFAHKVKDELQNPTTGMIDYENLTYGELFSTVKKLGIRMCIDQKLLRQQLKNSKKLKYEMGNFCEQFGLLPIAPSKAIRKKSKKFSRREPAPYYNTYKKRKFNKPSTSKNFSKNFKKSKKKKPESKFEKYFSKGKCFNCGETGHFADKCPKPPKKIKQEINALNISEDEKHNIFQILQNNAFSNYTSDEDIITSDEDIITSDDSDYHSASSYSSDEDVKIGCFDSCCNKKVFVLTKTEEHEDMLLKLISQIENPELKEEYLQKLKKFMTRKEKTPSTSKISLEETLERFSKPKTKVVTISDLQCEISNIKNDIVELKKEINVLKTNNKALEQEILLTKLKSSFPECNSDNEDAKTANSESSEHTNEVRSDNMFPNDFQAISLLNKVFPPKWYTKVHIIVAKDYSFDALALMDTGADLNCIQEGLVPSRYFEKSMETLSSASGNRMQINFELNNAHVCQNKICFHIPSVLIKNMSEQVILGMPFIAMIYPFNADLHGVKTNVMGVPINFQFASKFEVDICHQSMNMISAKTKHLSFLKQDVMYKKSLNKFLTNCFSQKLLLFRIK